MKNIIVIENYDELMSWLVEADYVEYVTSDGMFFEVKSNNILGDIDILLVENHNVKYISSNKTLYLFDEESCYSVDEDYAKKLIDYGYHLNN